MQWNAASLDCVTFMSTNSSSGCSANHWRNEIPKVFSVRDGGFDLH
jgi:hypothetical protein